jgi:acetoin utilization protein AcuB
LNEYSLHDGGDCNPRTAKLVPYRQEEGEMRVRDIMSSNVVAVDESTSIHDARKIMEAHKIRRLPVMRRDKLVGLVTKHMLLEASPSPATSLSIHELHYLLAKMTVKDIMVKNPFTIPPDMPVEEALQLGQEMGYGAFPVVENGGLVGIATESDIVRVMTKVLGVREKAKRIDIKAPREFGDLQRIMKILDEHKAVLLSLMTLTPEEEDDDWLIVLRLKGKDVRPIAKELQSSGFNVTYVG